MDRLREKFNYQNRIDVSASGSRSGLTLGWKDGIFVSLKSFNEKYIDVLIYTKDVNVDWCFTGFYGDPKSRDQVNSWALLSRLCNSY